MANSDARVNDNKRYVEAGKQIIVSNYEQSSFPRLIKIHTRYVLGHRRSIFESKAA